MMEDQNQEQQQQPEAVHAEAEAPSAPSGQPQSAEEYAEALKAVGIGDVKKTMTWLGKMMPKGVADGMKLPALTLLDPGKKKQYNDFLEKSTWDESRKLLKQRLSAWIRAIESGEDLDDIQEKASERADQLAELLNENLANVFESIRPVEKNYRAVDGFFSNAQAEPGAKIDAWFYNCSTEQLLDADDRTAFDELADKIRAVIDDVKKTLA